MKDAIDNIAWNKTEGYAGKIEETRGKITLQMKVRIVDSISGNIMDLAVRDLKNQEIKKETVEKLSIYAPHIASRLLSQTFSNKARKCKGGNLGRKSTSKIQCKFQPVTDMVISFILVVSFLFVEIRKLTK